MRAVLPACRRATYQQRLHHADPGGRLTWTVDAAAVAAASPSHPPLPVGLAMNVTVTRPAAFTGVVTVTATDSVLAARRETERVRFL